MITHALSSLVAEAARSVPHYNELFASVGFVPGRFGSMKDLGELPITQREYLADQPQAHFLHEDASKDRLYSTQTSGSTGTPSTLFLSKTELNYRRLLLFRAIRARFPRCLPLRIADVGQVTAPEMPQLTRRFGPLLLTRIPGILPISEQVNLYCRSSPQLLEGYAGCLELLAHELSIRKHYPKPHWLISRGEMLTSRTRKLLEEIFDCPVANFYNSEEVGNMAWGCSHREGIFHVNTDACVIELLDESDDAVSPGVAGRVILTNLYNRTMPFIRYDIGDHATWDNPDPHPCSCGAMTPTLASIDGRTDDFIFLSETRRLSPIVVLATVAQQLNGCSRVTPGGAHVPQIRQFQVVQEKMGEARVLLVSRDSLPSDLDDRIRSRFRKIHPGFRVKIARVPAISLEPSGKLKCIISRVKS